MAPVFKADAGARMRWYWWLVFVSRGFWEPASGPARGEAIAKESAKFRSSPTWSRML